jgi:hypothetical protein
MWPKVLAKLAGDKEAPLAPTTARPSMGSTFGPRPDSGRGSHGFGRGPGDQAAGLESSGTRDVLSGDSVPGLSWVFLETAP